MSTERYIVERLVHNRMKNRIRESQRSVPDSYYKKVAYILNHRLGQYESYVNVGDIDVISETPGNITLKVTYSVDVQIPMYDPEDRRTYYETDTEYRTQTMTFDFDELDEDLTPNHPANGPRIGSKVRILRGGYRGQIGKVVDIDFDEEEGDQYSVETPDKSIRYLDDTDIELIKEDLTLDDDPEETDQQYSSAATSINSSKLPALFSMVDFKEGSINLDYGGGRFDNVAEYLQDKYGATNLVYDKYNRSADHNREVLNQVRQNGGADTVTCSNVLNVIAEESERLAVLRNCKRYLKSGGTCYITVYEGNGKGEGAPTKSGYQLNRKTKDYEDEIKKVFSSVTRKGKLFVCR